MIWIILLFSCSITFAQLNTYDLIVEYEQECYVDSFQVTHHVAKGMPCFRVSTGYGSNFNCETQGHYNELIWVHREPSWDGFREFVKKEYDRLLRIQGAQ